MKLKILKDWANNNVSAMAWQRIVMRKLPEMRTSGFYLHTLTDEVELKFDLIVILNNALEELYQAHFPEDLIAGKQLVNH